ncbi:hypothetical protein O181_062840 [Austropuccinia psidii MF-1]|uniref:Uncharacterized protein n=1 Tax=Austropuccinia psidii MF-1 TaxID=1389203 RepID=A0A9Q3EHQ0_9BASI|nr:hypothetical protein [Austropuccinia psidii MF-1]
MPVQHSPPARQMRSQARTQAVITPTPRAPLDHNPEVIQLRTQFGRRSTIQEGRMRAKKIKFLLRGNGKEEEGNSVKEEESYGNEGFPAAVVESQVTGGPTLAQYNKPVSHKSELSLLEILQQMTQIMTNLQSDSSSE